MKHVISRGQANDRIFLLIAVSGLDYVPLDSAIAFGACDNRKCVNISIVDDQKVEKAEYFHIKLLRPPGLREGVTLNPIDGQIRIYSQDSTNDNYISIIISDFNVYS